MNKAEFIRAHADMSPAEIQAFAKQAGIAVSRKYIMTQLAKARTKRRAASSGGVTRDEYRAMAKEAASVFARHGATLTELGKFLTAGAGEDFSPSVRANLERFAADSTRIAEMVNRMHDTTIRRGHTYFREQAEAWQAGTLRPTRIDNAAE